MVQDYFSLFAKDKNLFLLRIHHKVDFSDEVAWAHCWDSSKENCLIEVVDKIYSYLTQGFDSIKEWSGDQEGWHESVKHLGFDPELIEMEMLAVFIEGSTDPFAAALFQKFNNNFDEIKGLVIPTFVGSLYRSLRKKNILCKKPRVPSAVCYIELASVLTQDWKAMVNKLDQYSLD